MKLLTSNNIEKLFWNELEVAYTEDVQLVTSSWQYSCNPNFKQVYFWEEIYREKGNISLYAARVPMIEFYLVVFELFQSFEKRYLSFYGKDSEKHVYVYFKNLGIDLSVSFRKIDDSETWLHENLI